MSLACYWFVLVLGLSVLLIFGGVVVVSAQSFMDGLVCFVGGVGVLCGVVFVFVRCFVSVKFCVMFVLW